jgi:hypothetical protein
VRLLRRCASRNDGPLAVIASRAKQSRYRERAVRMPAFWPTRSPTGEVAKVGFGSIVAVWERRGERRLLAGTEEKIHLSRQIVSLLWQSRPSRARPRAPPLARTCRSAMSPIGVRRGKADAEQPCSTAVLFEDLTGQGHTSRSVGGDRLTAIVPLAD